MREIDREKGRERGESERLYQTIPVEVGEGGGGFTQIVEMDATLNVDEFDKSPTHSVDILAKIHTLNEDRILKKKHILIQAKIDIPAHTVSYHHIYVFYPSSK